MDGDEVGGRGHRAQAFHHAHGVACAEAVEQAQEVAAAVVETHLPHVGGVYRAVFFQQLQAFELRADFFGVV